MIKGIGASPGIAIGKIFLLEKEDITITKQHVDNPENEVKILEDTFKVCIEELENVKNKTALEVGKDESAIFEAHIMVLKDPELINTTSTMIRNERINAAYAFKSVSEQFITVFESMENEYMRERACDIKDISERVLRKLTGTKSTDLSTIDEHVIIVTKDLTPSDTATMNKEKVLGFLTDLGGKTSHSAIMARILGIPAIVGLQDITARINKSSYVIIDGSKGDVIINPSEDVLIKYEQMRNTYLSEKAALKNYIGIPTKTKSGKKIDLFANIGSPDDVDALLDNDAEGVGLFRSEFLYMNRSTLPSEEEQFQAYKTVATRLIDKPVIIRTLDIGGDKEVDYLQIQKEMNPFLGYRAIRMCLCKIFTNSDKTITTCDNCSICKSDIFRTQLRAILRASHYGNIQIMFPMITNLDELLTANAFVDQVKEELDQEGILYNKNIQIGMMIEIPSAAIISDILAKHTDFFSIGTNDLIQYTCAVDRMNPKIQHLYDPHDKAVQRLIQMTIENGHKAGITVGMCGGMAEDESLIPTLLEYGLDKFSVSPSSILQVRKLINES